MTRAEYTGSYKPADTMTFVYDFDFQLEDIVTSSGDNLKRDREKPEAIQSSP